MTIDAPACTVDDLLHDASCALASGMTDQARRLLVDATCLDPYDARPLIELSELWEESDPEQAVRWLRRAVELEPDSPGLHARLAGLLASRVRTAD
jgi:Flp pilus assembly protein TadD